MATSTGQRTESDPFSPYRSDGKLYGFVCVVTGAQQPVGQAIITELATHGAACIYGYKLIMPPACDELSTFSTNGHSSPSSYAHLLPTTLSGEKCNTQIIPYPLTITSEASTLALIDDILNNFGRLDIWVCSSGLLGPPSIYDTSPEDLKRCWESNSVAPFFALKYAPKAMIKMMTKEHYDYKNAEEKNRGYGSIVVVGSVASEYGGCWGPCYTMASHAALGVVRAGVVVLKGTGVRINCISPGQVDVGVDLKGFDMRGMTSQLPPSSLQSKEATKQTIPLERAGLPFEIARVAGFLASDFSSYITGANLVVDGGASVMNPLMIPMIGA